MLRARNLSYPLGSVFFLLIFGLPVGTVGGHLFNRLIPILLNATHIESSLSGLTVIGSIVACLLYGYLSVKYILKKHPLEVLDSLAFTFPLSIMLGRIGCLFAGCCHGRPAAEQLTASPLSIFMLPANLYVEPSFAWKSYHDLPADAMVWNLPLLLMINALIALIVTELAYRKKSSLGLVNGTVMALTATMYTGGRLVVEYVRQEGMVGNSVYNPWQIAMILLFIASLVTLIVFIGKSKKSLFKSGGLA